MTEPQDKLATTTALDRQGARSVLHRTDFAGISLSIIWVLSVLAYVLGAPAAQEGRTLGVVLTLMVLFLPLVLIWIALVTLRSLRTLRSEAARLQVSVDAMRNAYVLAQQAQATGGFRPFAERQAVAATLAARQTEAPIAGFTSRRDIGPTTPSSDQMAALVTPVPEPNHLEPPLALGTPAEDFRAPLLVSDFIIALNFPDSPDDRDGFRALRRALEDRTVSRLIRAAQDVLTLLSQEGIYMDDLKPDLARPEVWRRFARGERGRAIAALGGVRDRSCLALTAARMREDTIFRDAGHHFLRSFDRTIAMFEPNATDADLMALADTRTSRAFMLFGRVTGTFD